MASGAVDGMFRNIFEGCISSSDYTIERRPYHKNCRCALHDRSRGSGKSPNSGTSPCRRHGIMSEVVYFPIKRSWSEGNSMALHLTSSSSSSNLHSLSSSPSISTLASLSSTASLAMLDTDSAV